jgi:hypothetical protein
LDSYPARVVDRRSPSVLARPRGSKRSGDGLGRRRTADGDELPARRLLAKMMNACFREPLIETAKGGLDARSGLEERTR